MRTRMVPASGGIELSVDVWEGGGVPFVLVHGLASNARLWDGVAGELHRAGHLVAAVDQRGHGRSAKPDDGYDFDTVAADLAAVVGALALERPVLVGQSWGGHVVAHTAARHPHLARAIACLDGGWVDLRRFGSWEACVETLSPPPLAGTPLAELERVLRARHADWPESGIQGVLACFQARPDGTIAPWLSLDRHLRILRAMWEQRPLEVLARIEEPVLLLPCDDGSEHVEGKRREVADAERALRRGRTTWLVADHDAHAQRPAEVARLLLEALADGFFGP